ncbi:12734_t:CDS:2 [Entrophospora sp. SA101]|nr:12734_t:CDS:2 [Entrophospora sp. SA101]
MALAIRSYGTHLPSVWYAFSIYSSWILRTYVISSKNPNEASVSYEHEKDKNKDEKNNEREEDIIEMVDVEGNDDKVEVEHIDKSLYPELFPEKNELNELSDEDGNNEDVKGAREEDFTWFVDPKYENPQENAVDDEDFIPMWQRKASVVVSDLSSATSKFEGEGGKHLEMVKYLEDEGIENITIIDVSKKSDFADWMIIGEGKSSRHMGGAVDGLYKMLKDNIKKQNLDASNSSSLSYPIVEGRDSDEWMLIYTETIFVHLFTPEERKYRNLEKLWESIPSYNDLSDRDKRISTTKDIMKGFKGFNPKFSLAELEEKFHGSLENSVESILNTTHIVGLRECADQINRTICNLLSVLDNKIIISKSTDMLSGKIVDFDNDKLRCTDWEKVKINAFTREAFITDQSMIAEYKRLERIAANSLPFSVTRYFIYQ